ncbi:MAG TPA: RNA polymerase sigma-70 factor [Hanamia sp.]|nr:RNA polymerase sigma-70 factor [Hanamia sp.]
MNQTEIQNCLFKISHQDDARSFKELYRYYFLKLFRFCMGIVHHKESAEEIVHNVFMNVWDKRRHLPEIENPDVYLYVAVKNNSLDYLRKNRLKQSVDISTIDTDSFVLHINPEQLMITEEMRKTIRQAIEQLPPRCKQIFTLIKEDGLKYKEVASILNLSVKTVEAQMAIATKKLISAVLVYSNADSFQKRKQLFDNITSN